MRRRSESKSGRLPNLPADASSLNPGEWNLAASVGFSRFFCLLHLPSDGSGVEHAAETRRPFSHFCRLFLSDCVVACSRVCRGITGSLCSLPRQRRNGSDLSLSHRLAHRRGVEALSQLERLWQCAAVLLTRLRATPPTLTPPPPKKGGSNCP